MRYNTTITHQTKRHYFIKTIGFLKDRRPITCIDRHKKKVPFFKKKEFIFFIIREPNSSKKKYLTVYIFLKRKIYS